MTCGECKNVTAPGAGFPNHVYCKRFLLHMEKQKDASNCSYFIPKPTTNADRVRGMTVDELARFLAVSDACPPRNPKCWHECCLCWYEWLKTEVF